MVGEPLGLGRASAVLVVGDNGNDLRVQPADTDLVDEMQERMIEPGDEDEDLRLHCGVRENGPHLETLDGRAQGPLDITSLNARRNLKCDAHEKAVGLCVPELVAFGDVRAERGKLGGDGRDDAGFVVAGKHKNEGLRRHDLLRLRRFRMRPRAPSQPLPMGS
ncbi:hypothetical protein D9M72_482440 [compost metagenome]